MHRRHRTWGVLVALLALAGCGAGPDADDAASDTVGRTVTVERFADIARPARGSAPAEVRAVNQTSLASELTARVAQIHVDEGTRVQRNALLLELDATDLELARDQAGARLEAAQASVRLLERRLERARSLRRDQFVSEDELLTIETELGAARADAAVAEADLRVAMRNVDKARITAPFAGIVSERSAHLGMRASVGTPLLEMVDGAPPEVRAALQPEDAASLEQAESLEFRSRGVVLPLRLVQLSPIVDRNARTRSARLRFVDDEAPPGSSGSLSWVAPLRELPAALLVQRDQQSGVFVAEGSIARFVPVPDAQEGRPFRVDLAPDARVVVRGQQSLQDGDPLAPTADEETP